MRAHTALFCLAALTGCAKLDDEGCPHEAHPAVHYASDQPYCMTTTVLCAEDEAYFASKCGCGCTTPRFLEAVADRME